MQQNEATPMKPSEIIGVCMPYSNGGRPLNMLNSLRIQCQELCGPNAETVFFACLASTHGLVDITSNTSVRWCCIRTLNFGN